MLFCITVIVVVTGVCTHFDIPIHPVTNLAAENKAFFDYLQLDRVGYFTSMYYYYEHKSSEDTPDWWIGTDCETYHSDWISADQPYLNSGTSTGILAPGKTGNVVSLAWENIQYYIGFMSFSVPKMPDIIGMFFWIMSLIIGYCLLKLVRGVGD